jgi:hypothetical protein
LATKIPTAFKHRLKDKAHARLKTGIAAAAAASSFNKTQFEFLYDSGAEQTQIPSYMRGLLDNIRSIPAVELETPGGGSPVCTEMGTLRFTVKGVSEVIELECLLNPSSHILMISLDEFERMNKGRWRGLIMSRLWKDEIDFKGVSVPLVRRGKAPFLRINVLSGYVDECAVKKLPFRTRGGACASHANRKYAYAPQNGGDPYDFVHRLCGHANSECCKRTAAKAEGLPSLDGVPKPSRPCAECAMAKLKAPSKGFGDLSTGLKPTRPGQVFCGDTFGPIAIRPWTGGREIFHCLGVPILSLGGD